MNKKILASMCALFILASASPIFACNAHATNKTAVLTDGQLAKLNTTQTRLTNLVTKIENLKTQYANTTKAKGLLVALNRTEKQANKLNNQITAYKANPTKPVNAKIRAFQHKTYKLQWKVALIEKILKKLAKKHHVKHR
jgi:peptidoglycan hydrolase CwlO-like protein